MTRLIHEVDRDLMPVDDHRFYDDGAYYATTVRISNPGRENGLGDNGPLSWLNSAKITADRADDAVHLSVSVGDPRGAFVITFRRGRNGELLISVPSEADNAGACHEHVRELDDGLLIVTNHDGEPLDYSDEECIDCGGTNVEAGTCLDCEAKAAAA